MSKSHTDGVLAMLTGISGLTVYDGKVPNLPALPYTVLFTNDGVEMMDNLEASPDLITVTFQLTSSGLTRTSVQIAAGKAHGGVIALRPTVTGRTCSVIRQTASQPITLDEDVDPPLFFAANQYAFFSVAS